MVSASATFGWKIRDLIPRISFIAYRGSYFKSRGEGSYLSMLFGGLCWYGIMNSTYRGSGRRAWHLCERLQYSICKRGELSCIWIVSSVEPR